MKLLSKALMSGLMLCGAILGSKIDANAAPWNHVGMCTGAIVHKKRKDTSNSRRYNYLLDEYLRGFDYKLSRANDLFPNNEYTFNKIVNIVRYVSSHAKIKLDRFILRSKACCYKFIDTNFELFLMYRDSFIEEKSYESEAEMDLSHDDRYALGLEISTFLGKPLPEGADVEPLVLSKFLVENESFRCLTDQINVLKLAETKKQ